MVKQKHKDAHFWLKVKQHAIYISQWKQREVRCSHVTYQSSRSHGGSTYINIFTGHGFAPLQQHGFNGTRGSHHCSTLTSGTQTLKNKTSTTYNTSDITCLCNKIKQTTQVPTTLTLRLLLAETQGLWLNTRMW